MLLNWKKKTEDEKRDTFVGASGKFETNNEMSWFEMPLRRIYERINLSLCIQKAPNLLKP